MGWVKISERDFHRIEVLAQVDDARLSVPNGAKLLDVTLWSEDVGGLIVDGYQTLRLA